MTNDSQDESRPPHLDVGRWDDLIESLGPESILVVIGHWMSDKLRAQISSEDIWQETLLHAWQDRESHEWVNPRKYRAWLLAIARNRIRNAVDFYAAQKRGGGQATTPLHSIQKGQDGSISAVLPGRSTTPSMIASVGERAKRMEEALASLDEDSAKVVRMHLFEEISMQAIADKVGISKSTAWQRFRKGAQVYAQKLASLGGAPTHT